MKLCVQHLFNQNLWVVLSDCDVVYKTLFIFPLWHLFCALCCVLCMMCGCVGGTCPLCISMADLHTFFCLSKNSCLHLILNLNEFKTALLSADLIWHDTYAVKQYKRKSILRILYTVYMWLNNKCPFLSAVSVSIYVYTWPETWG